MHFPAKPNGRAVLVGPHGAKSFRLDSIAGMESVFGGNERGTRLSPAVTYQTVAIARRCVDLRARRVSTLPWAIYPAGTERGDYEAALYTEADASAPDGLRALDDLAGCIYRASGGLALTGAAYHLLNLDGPGARNGQTMRLSGLQHMDPRTVEPERTPDGVSGFWRTVNARREWLPVEAVWHVWEPDPFAEQGPGTADAVAAGLPARVLDAIASFLADHAANGLIGATVLRVSEGYDLDEVQKGEAKSLWRRLLRLGSKSPDFPAVLDGIEADQIGGTVKDLDGAGPLMEHMARAVCLAFGVPYELLNGDVANYASATVFERALILDTVAPEAKLIAGTLTRQVLRGYGLEMRVEPERHPVMQHFQAEFGKEIVALTGGPVLTPEEGRGMLNKSAVPEEGELRQPAARPAPGGDGATRSLPTEPPRLSFGEHFAAVLADRPE